MKEQEFEHILRQALCLQIDPEEIIVHGMYSRKGNTMNIKQLIKKTCIVAAVIMLLTTTVYAADSLNIKTLLTGSSTKTYDTVAQAEKAAGFEIDDKNTFSNGYTFSNARVVETKALDKDNRVRLTYNEIDVELHNVSGDRLNLSAYESNDRIEQSRRSPDLTRNVGEITVDYRVDHYKFVPADYELTQADEAQLKQPGYYISYGAETVTESDVAFLTWKKDAICYILMDMDASEPADSLFSMAQDMILTGE